MLLQACGQSGYDHLFHPPGRRPRVLVHPARKRPSRFPPGVLRSARIAWRV